MGRRSSAVGGARTAAGKVAQSLKKESGGWRFSCGLECSAMTTLILKTAALILFYYATSIGLTFYQNWLLKKVKFPLSIVMVHFILKLLLSWLSRLSYSLYTGLARVSLGWSQFLGRIGIVALVASLDIGLSQWSFEYIEVALYTITKSTSIIFILFFAIILGLERKHWSLIFIVLMIATGLCMFTYKSTDFSAIGFFMVLSASFLSGIRWTLSQLIMQKSGLGLSNPIDMIFHIQPIMIVALLPFTLGFEGATITRGLANIQAAAVPYVLQCVGEVAAGGVLAFLMEAAEFLLVTHTSSLTLSIAGILKEVISLSLAVVYQSHDLSLVNLVGLVVCLLGISCHIVRKATDMPEVPSRQNSRYISSRTGEIALPLLSGSESDSEEELYRGSAKLPYNKKTSQEMQETLLKDNRQWTSVKDRHVENLKDVQDAVSPEQNQVQQLSKKEQEDALDEADKLLQQLDLLASD